MVDNQPSTRNERPMVATVVARECTPHPSHAFRHRKASQRENDGESGLMHYRARSYDPRIGRFVQRDAALRNKFRQHYVYSENNPVLYVDPTGLQSKDQQLTEAEIQDLILELEDAADWLELGQSGLPDRLFKHWRAGSGGLVTLTEPEIEFNILASPQVKEWRADTERDMQDRMREVKSGGLRVVYERKRTSEKKDERIKFNKPGNILDRTPNAQCFYAFNKLTCTATYEGVVSEIPDTDVLRFDGTLELKFSDSYGFQGRNWGAIPGRPDLTDRHFQMWELHGTPAAFPVEGVYREEKYCLLADKTAPQPARAQSTGSAVSYDDADGAKKAD